MKRSVTNFITGLASGLLIAAMPITALASTGHMTIDVDPITILVNGQIFQPTDAAGKAVPVFCWNGTSYAPVRALAEAYGLTVGYDPVQNVATVSNSATALAPTPAPVVQPDSYEDFEKQWTVKEKPVTNYGNEKIFTVTYSGDLSMSDFKSWWKSYELSTLKDYTERMAAEIQSTVPGYVVTAYFSYGTNSLGTVRADGATTGSNFDVARIWIK